ncbi:UDP-N-acetylmuramate:L-alanyl-gamma-D-glutamyl-meso-diaminopimelate ligase [hydrothermal vent metagenome]|uniref:UDP-N-acetylmuramate:L-alanyl-gamma-D-glutamyl-meso-diaminopimelate ligase n=1 Tax=hydrothermal vent metagenome TaxID=652676 RepID=A0A3B1AT01_9ZZZZ
MHIHILGICGTFMGGIALLAREMGLTVSGSDQNVYPPMSTQLSDAGIELTAGFDPAQLEPSADLIVIGNALSRGNPAVEAVLERGLPYTSGPAFLAEQLLADRWVLAVAGTHGKTTTASMLAWILEDAGLAPGFLIGGVPRNFGRSARMGKTPFFVVEADEYDTAFFDKRSKFVHYRPRTVVLNNLEYDHADIFPDIEAIERQFHHLLRTVPGNGLIIAPDDDPHITKVLNMGRWTPLEPIGKTGWHARLNTPDGSDFEVFFGDDSQGHVHWELLGQHNVHNALAAIAGARHAGVPTKYATEALGRFLSPKRRMEIRGEIGGVTVYDDFAHHPTAITTTLAGLRARVGRARILAVLEPRSNTMRLGIHRDTLGPALSEADDILLYQPTGLDWNLNSVTRTLGTAQVFDDIDRLAAHIAETARCGDHVVIMSNGAFGGLHEKLLHLLTIRQENNEDPE